MQGQGATCLLTYSLASSISRQNHVHVRQSRNDTRQLNAPVCRPCYIQGLFACFEQRLPCWNNEVYAQAEEVLGGTRSTRADPDVLADQSVISHYNRLTGRNTGSSSSSAAGPGGASSKQRPIEGECAVCYDTLKVWLLQKIAFCLCIVTYQLDL